MHHSGRIFDSEPLGQQGQSVIEATDGQPIVVRGEVSELLWSALLALAIPDHTLSLITTFILIFRPREAKV